jgi:hypothetical protein
MVSTATGDQLSSPSDYQKFGHVSPDVVEDVAAWISSPGPISK